MDAMGISYSCDSRSTNISTSIANVSTLELGEVTLEMVKEMVLEFEENPILTQTCPKDKYVKETSCYYCEKKKKKNMFGNKVLLNWYSAAD